MPLPSDEKLIQLGNDILRQFETIFGPHPGFRPAHAKGLLLTGRFTRHRKPHASRARRTFIVSPLRQRAVLGLHGCP